MGRKRTIDRDAVLDAVQAVVLRDGASQLTIDAVATEAGISKASVLYDYKTKQALIRALIDRRIDDYRRRTEEIAAGLGRQQDAGIRAHIEGARRLLDEDQALATSLCAAMAQDAELRAPVREVFSAAIADFANASHPRGALLAFLAVEGLRHLEWFGFHHWPAAERDRLLDDIAWLAEQDPAPPAAPAS